MKELSLHVLDLIENAAASGAQRINVLIIEDPENDRLRISVSDDGQGMPPELLKRVLDPFTTTRKTRKVGLGLSLLASAAQQAGGRIAVWSEPAKGTKVRVEFQLSHLDRAPLGRIEDTILSALTLHPNLDLFFRHRSIKGSYSLESNKLSSKGNPVVTRDEIRKKIEAGRVRIESNA